jgi:superfamily II DNA/RNA helicase
MRSPAMRSLRALGRGDAIENRTYCEPLDQVLAGRRVILFDRLSMFEGENADDYDLMALDERFDMVRTREHSAQIPAVEREYIERQFKGEGELLNTFVCTPTLELGVDIGSLDAILMRNIPPLPANYWQRAGRAGRQFRMAVTIAYARPASHDRAYFAEPHKMLDGRILPPGFNLKNEPMIRKHVHASVLTALHQLVRAFATWSEWYVYGITISGYKKINHREHRETERISKENCSSLALAYNEDC